MGVAIRRPTRRSCERSPKPLGLSRDRRIGRDSSTRREPQELPADLLHMADRKLVPALLRSIDNRQLDDKEIARLIDEIDARHGGRGDALR